MKKMSTSANELHISQRPPAATVRVGRDPEMVILTGRAAEVWETPFRVFLNLWYFNEAAADVPNLVRELTLRGAKTKIKHAGEVIETIVVSSLDDLENAVWAVVRKHRHDIEVHERLLARIEERKTDFVALGGHRSELWRIEEGCGGNLPALNQKISAAIKALERTSKCQRNKAA